MQDRIQDLMKEYDLSFEGFFKYVTGNNAVQSVTPFSDANDTWAKEAHGQIARKIYTLAFNYPLCFVKYHDLSFNSAWNRLQSQEKPTEVDIYRALSEEITNRQNDGFLGMDGRVELYQYFGPGKHLIHYMGVRCRDLASTDGRCDLTMTMRNSRSNTLGEFGKTAAEFMHVTIFDRANENRVVDSMVVAVSPLRQAYRDDLLEGADIIPETKRSNQSFIAVPMDSIEALDKKSILPPICKFRWSTYYAQPEAIRARYEADLFHNLNH